MPNVNLYHSNMNWLFLCIYISQISYFSQKLKTTSKNKINKKREDWFHDNQSPLSALRLRPRVLNEKKRKEKLKKKEKKVKVKRRKKKVRINGIVFLILSGSLWREKK